jgi:hypothetical protein
MKGLKMGGPIAKDEAGPLWILMENFLESLPPWGRMAVGACFLLAVIALIALVATAIYRKKPKRD